MTAGGGRTRDTLREMQTLRPLGQGEANENKGITNYKINLGSQNFIFFFFFFFLFFVCFFFGGVRVENCHISEVWRDF